MVVSASFQWHIFFKTTGQPAFTFNELRSSATGSQASPDRVCTPAAVARTRSSSFRISSKERLSHSLPCATAPRRSSSNLAADASSTCGIRHTATTKPPSSYNFFPLLMHINETIPHRSTTSQTNVGMCNSQDLTDSPYRDLKRCNKCWRDLFVDPWHVTNMIWLNPTSVEGSKTFINELRSSARGSQASPDRVSTPAAVARTRTSSLPIPYKARLSHSSPSETAPRRSSSNLAADASSTCGIRHTATTKQPSPYNFFPLLMHINENITHRSTTSQTNMGMITMQFSRSHGQPLQRPKEMQQMLKIFVCRSLVCHKHDAMSHKHSNSITKTTHVTTHILVEPDLRGRFQDFHQRVAQLCYRQPLPVRLRLRTMEHTATTKQPSPYNFCPLLMHINEIITHRSTTSQTKICMITMQFSRSHGQPLQRPKEMQHMLKRFVCRSLACHKHDAMSDSHANSITKTTHVTTHFLVEPNLRGGFQDFHQRVAQFCYRQPSLAGSCLHTTRSSQDSKLLFSHFVQSTTEPLLALWNSSKAKFFQFGSRCLFHLRHPTHCHHKTTIILQFLPAAHAYQWNNNT